MPDTEQQLIQRAQKGDQEAFAVLVTEHQRYVFNLAVRVLKNEEEALDLAQETFVRALRQTSIENERAWLFAVATNLVRDEARKDARRRRHLTLLAEQAKAEEPVDPEPTSLERAQEAGGAPANRTAAGSTEARTAR